MHYTRYLNWAYTYAAAIAAHKMLAPVRPGLAMEARLPGMVSNSLLPLITRIKLSAYLSSGQQEMERLGFVSALQ